ncbi:MAG: hypothetical protein ACYC6F_12575 [Longimicrobiales bacterium]
MELSFALGRLGIDAGYRALRMSRDRECESVSRSGHMVRHQISVGVTTQPSAPGG